MKTFKFLINASVLVLIGALLFSCQQDEISVSSTGVQFILSPGFIQDDGARTQQFPTVDEGMCDLLHAAYVKMVIENVPDEITLPIRQISYWRDKLSAMV